MQFTILEYEADGHRPVEEFLEGLRVADPRLWGALTAGVKKLEDSSNHHEPLTKKLKVRYGGGVLPLFEVRSFSEKQAGRVIYATRPGATIVLLHGLTKRGDDMPQEDLELAKQRYLALFGPPGGRPRKRNRDRR